MPLPPHSSSITEEKWRSPCGGPQTFRNASTAIRYAATPAFMSPAPRPHMRPSATSAPHGSRVQRSIAVDRHDVDVAAQVQRAAVAGALQPAGDVRPPGVRQRRIPAARILERLDGIDADPLDDEPEPREALVDETLGALLGPEHGLLADEEGGQLAEVVEALVDGLPQRGDQEVRSRAISSNTRTNWSQSSKVWVTDSVHSSSRPGVMKTPRFML